MRRILKRWIADAETRYGIQDFQLNARLSSLDYLNDRTFDLYYALVGELFALFRNSNGVREDWSALGRAFASIGRDLHGEARADAVLFSASAFYCGGFPASALLTMREADAYQWQDDVSRACYDLLARNQDPISGAARGLIAAVRTGSLDEINRAVTDATLEAQTSLEAGPDEWVPRQLYAALIRQFQNTNLRSVLPEGIDQRWNPLVESFLNRARPVWDFFPSQIEAIEAGLLTSGESYSLQMPTGAGKTALTETLLFNHLTQSPTDKAVLLVPYRALARELRYTVGRNLTRMGLRSRTIYGGTVPSFEERESLDDVRAIIATPESLSGLLGSRPELLSAISLVVCDEGHLLDSEARGIGLELLLARLRARTPSPRMVFVSAIVPNVEEINSWLGGSPSTVVRSNYRAAIAEYAVLRPTGSGKRLAIGLELQEVGTSMPTHTIPGFLQSSDFAYINPGTRRINTYKFSTMKSQAVAAACRSLTLGAVAIFSTAKFGAQGVIGLAEELNKQIEAGLPLPSPSEHIGDGRVVEETVDYLVRDFGAEWIGARTLKLGAILHHGDLPQECREVLEELVTGGHVSMVFCTSTLAEGVNLPIRTLVLYSVRRSSSDGAPIPMLARDIKNLVGRAGRAGSSTKGLVICVNPDQWEDVKPVADGEPGEPVRGALANLLQSLERELAGVQGQLTNEDLERAASLFPLVDGIDATLIELIREELGSEEFQRIAEEVASQTFAATRAGEEQGALLRRVFRLRASRILDARGSGRLALVGGTAGRLRLIDSVIDDLYSSYDGWSVVDSPLDPDFLEALLGWAFSQPDFGQEVAYVYRVPDAADVKSSVMHILRTWLEGRPFVDIANIVGLPIDRLLQAHTKIVLYGFTTLIEQAVALIQQQSAVEGATLSTAVVSLPDYLRYGVSTDAARELMANGVRHRRAAVALASNPRMAAEANVLATPRIIARDLLEDRDFWIQRLGPLIYGRTVDDVAAGRE